jgi:predicted TPR repeat methyltransferase
MSDAKEKNGDREAAVELLNEAIVLADEVPQLTFRAAAYNEIGRRFMTFGNADQATDVFLKSLHAIGEVRDISAQAVALAGLAQIASDTKAEIEMDDSIQATLRALAQKAGR